MSLPVENGCGQLEMEELSGEEEEEERRRMCKGLLLCVCYSASIGGIATLTGTGPNLVFMGQLKQSVLTRSLGPTHTPPRTHTHAHSDTHTPPRTHTHAHSDTYRHTHTLTLTHTGLHTDMHTYTK